MSCDWGSKKGSRSEQSDTIQGAVTVDFRKKKKWWQHLAFALSCGASLAFAEYLLGALGMYTGFYFNELGRFVVTGTLTVFMVKYLYGE